MCFHALAVALLMAGPPADPKLEMAAKQAKQSVEATVKGDYEALLDLTHPKLVALMGGREAALTRIRKEMASTEQMGLAFDSYEMGTATDLRQTKDGTFCLVPMTLRMKMKGRKISKKSALLGISTDGGKTWKFADTTRGEPLLRKVLPEIPAGLEIPKPEKPVMEDDAP